MLWWVVTARQHSVFSVKLRVSRDKAWLSCFAIQLHRSRKGVDDVCDLPRKGGGFGGPEVLEPIDHPPGGGRRPPAFTGRLGSSTCFCDGLMEGAAEARSCP